MGHSQFQTTERYLKKDSRFLLNSLQRNVNAQDNERLIETLIRLRDLGNTVLVVEHDEDMIRVADHIVDIGLGAGEQGGRVVYSGDLPGLLLETRSLTAKYLRHELAIPVPATRRRGSSLHRTSGSSTSPTRSRRC